MAVRVSLHTCRVNRPRPRGTFIRANDCVLMSRTLEDPVRTDYVAKIVEITADKYNKNDVTVHVRRFYRPEETLHGRQDYHGEKELLWSNHSEVRPVGCINGVCNVYTMDDYEALSNELRPIDFFWRFEYDCNTHVVTPKPTEVPLFCLCRQPNNPDRPMVLCDECRRWFHFACIGFQNEVEPNLVCSRHEPYNNGGPGDDGI